MIRRWARCVVLALPAFALMTLGWAGEEPNPPREPDCGSCALYTLLRLEDRPTSLSTIASRLGPPKPGGYSMKELRDAARACGLPLTGVILQKEERAIDRPMIVFLKRGPHGHFLVIRPLGVTGKLVQVIDSVRPPGVEDKADLTASPEWTGIALISEGSNGPKWLVAVCVASLSAIVVGLLWKHFNRLGVTTSFYSSDPM